MKYILTTAVIIFCVLCALPAFADSPCDGFALTEVTAKAYGRLARADLTVENGTGREVYGVLLLLAHTNWLTGKCEFDFKFREIEIKGKETFKITFPVPRGTLSTDIYLGGIYTSDGLVKCLPEEE
jgi:hypothetical protein